MKTIFCTLGPSGTCHDNAVKNYIKFQNIQNAAIEYISDFTQAVELLKMGSVDYIIQNCAHPQVSELNEKYCTEIFVIDTYVFPTKPMGILRRKDAKEKKVLGLMPATKGYINLEDWDELIYESANPIVGENLLKGKYEYGISFIEYAEKNSTILEVYHDFGGPVDTAWIVYGRERKCTGEVLGSKKSFYLAKEVL